MEILYQDSDIVVCIKPARVLSTDEPGGLPDLLREELGTMDFRTMVHGIPEPCGTLTDLLVRDKARKMTMVTDKPGKDVQPAVLHYQRLSTVGALSEVRIQLVTGRTHQIRVQFASRGMPLVGERKYAELADDCEIALWSCRIAFAHPKTGVKMDFYQEPPKIYPWNLA